ncbi:MAG: ABC transporter permease [Defluviitaleaceae bacterium]|nr:ABC transporter permease [Defluviitaleaceae bacterium]MCL2273812.1 ABC transporter permease [Defluviitaleaceae bacterium]
MPGFQMLPATITYDDYVYFSQSPFVDDIQFTSFMFNPSAFGFDANGESLWHKVFNENELTWTTQNGIEKTALQNLLRQIAIVGFNDVLLPITGFHFNVVEGRMFENDNEAVAFRNVTIICGDFVQMYTYEIGDSITFAQGEFYKTFTIVGLLDETEWENARPSPALFTTFSGAEVFNIFPQKEQGLGLDGASGFYIPAGYDAIIYLRSADDFEFMRNVVQRRTNGTHSLFMRHRNEHITHLNTMTAMQQFSNMLALISATFIVALTIITAIIMVNSRKYDIAVLRAMGMSKFRLIIGYIMENLFFIWIVFFVAAIVGIGTFIIIYPQLLGQFFIPLQIPILSPIVSSLLINFGLITITTILSIVISSGLILFTQPLKLLNLRD